VNALDAALQPLNVAAAAAAGRLTACIPHPAGSRPSYADGDGGRTVASHGSVACDGLISHARARASPAMWTV